MAKFLVSTMPATGHVNPFFQTVAKLAECGHEVWWHTGSAVREKVEATGARFIPMVQAHDIVQSTLEAQQKDGLAAANQAMINLFVAPMLGQLQDYQEILSDFPADALLVDMCSLGAALLHEKGGPVWASVGINPFRTAESPLYGSGQMPARSGIGRLRNRALNKLSERFLVEVTRTYNRQRNQVGLPTIPRGKTVFDYLTSPYLHLQGTTPAFEFPYGDLPAQVHFGTHAAAHTIRICTAAMVAGIRLGTSGRACHPGYNCDRCQGAVSNRRPWQTSILVVAAAKKRRAGALLRMSVSSA
jgi:UDP:flavonoid glycosyltransferase YjiC (YdhE family)